MVRLIRRYGGGSRKLYDTEESRYVSLEDVAGWVRQGQQLKIVENDGGADVTAQTLAQAIYEMHRTGTASLGAGFLHQAIRRGSRVIINAALGAASRGYGTMKKTHNGNGTLAPVKQSARAIWLAGLGVLATAGDESSRLFQDLVKRGEQADKANRGKVRKLVAGAEELRQDAEATIGKRLGRPIDKGVNMALHRLGVPTRGEILALTRRVEALTRTVEKQRRPRRATRKHAAAAPKVHATVA